MEREIVVAIAEPARVGKTAPCWLTRGLSSGPLPCVAELLA